MVASFAAPNTLFRPSYIYERPDLQERGEGSFLLKERASAARSICDLSFSLSLRLQDTRRVIFSREHQEPP